MNSYPVSAVKISHDIVETLVERETVGVTELANALDLPKSTAHDHLRTLEQLGYLVNEDGAYRLSAKFLHIGKTARDTHELFVHGREETLGLFDRLEDRYVQLVAEENGRCAVLMATGWQDQHPSQGGRSYPTHVPLHTNAPGKAILAALDREAVDEIVAEHGLAQRTPDTIGDSDELAEELDRTRTQGYAVDRGELIAGMCGVAVSVTTDHDVHGAVAAYSTTEKFPEDPGDLVAELERTTEAIEANFIFTD